MIRAPSFTDASPLAQVVFEIMGIFAVLTNTTLMAMSPQVRELFPNMTTTHYILMFVIVEVSLSVIPVKSWPVTSSICVDICVAS